jgi:two-component system sensor histidine kinase DegS
MAPSPGPAFHGTRSATGQPRRPGLPPDGTGLRCRPMELATAGPLDAAEDEAFAALRRESFLTRARAVFWARLGFLALGVAILSVPAWADSFGARFPDGLPVVAAMLAYGLAAFLLADRPVGRAANYVALCLDTAILVHLVLASGGLSSPLLATQVILASVFAALFPRPLAIAPALVALPLVAELDLLAGRPEEGGLELLVLLWYAALDVAVAAVVVLLHRREVAHGRERVRLEARLRELAVAGERQRIAREIHDGLGSALAGLSLQAEWTEARAQGEVRRELAELRNAVAECLEELRRALRVFRGDFDLGAAVADHGRVVAARSRATVVCDVAEPLPRLDPGKAHDLFRVLQEALSNALRHGGAGRIEVALRAQGPVLRLEVRDDGVGFAPAAEAPGHYGLLGIRERVARHGGDARFDTAPGKGTRVIVEVPVEGGSPGSA